MKTIWVAAAVIRDKDRVFATQRGYGDWKDYWEFPGGKIEPGETPEEALRREILEELDTEIAVGEKLATVDYDYPEFHLTMDCFWCSIVRGKLELLEAEDAAWLTKETLMEVNWLPADLKIIGKIKEALYGKETPMTLTFEKAKELNRDAVTEEHLIIHSLNVCYAMEAMARHFGADPEHWKAVGYLHDFDYQNYPEEHLKHTEKELLALNVDPADVRAIMSHGYSICTDVEPLTEMEKSLFTVDELTGIIQACARMRPNGILDLELKSFMKKFKDRKFAAKCDRDTILKGCEMLGMEVADVAAICIDGMRAHAEEIGLAGRGK